MNLTNESINQSIASAPFEILGHTAPFTTSPTLDIFLISLVVSLFITLVNKYMTDQVRIKALKADMKKIQKNMRETMKTDPQKAQKMQKEIMKKNFENIKYMLNPKVIIITMLPLLIVFAMIVKIYAPFGQFFNVFGWFTLGWLGTYIIFSIFNSILLKKLLNVA